MPPLVNGHTHAAMTLFRGSGGDLPLMPWLEERIWPVEAQLEPEDVYWGTRLACLEMIRSGTTRFWDMYWHPEATARAVADAGLRATIGAPFFDKGRDAGRRSATPARESLAMLEGARRPDHRRARPALDLHGQRGVARASSPSSRPSATRRSRSTSPRRRPRSRTASPSTACAPPPTSTDLGLLTERTLLAHGVWLDDDELALVAARGATVVSNPAANMKLAVGKVFPYPAARAAGVRVGLGTDGAGSNDSLDLLADLKLFALAQRHAAADATAIAVADAWAIATGARGAAARRHPARGRRARRLPPARPGRPRAGDRRPRPPTSSTPPTAPPSTPSSSPARS